MGPKKMSNKILVAVNPKDVAMMSDALGFEFEAVICHTIKEALSRLDQNISLVLCGLRFDGGQIFELLRHVKNNPSTKAIPFYSVAEKKNIFTPAILGSVQLAGKAMGADGFINLFDVADTDTEQTAHERLRHTVRACLEFV